MKMENLVNEEMFVLVAPDGSPQTSTLSPDFAMCIAMVELLASKGIGQSVGKLFQQGYKILPVKVSIEQNGNAEDGFQKFKKSINKQIN